MPADSAAPELSQGRKAENRALEFLEAQGLRLMERNYHCRYGEIDLIMEHGRSVVFVEVRFRRSARFGNALESVDRRKQAKLLATAASFLRDRRLDRPSRFDVAALSPDRDGLAVEWVQDAFRAD